MNLLRILRNQLIVKLVGSTRPVKARSVNRLWVVFAVLMLVSTGNVRAQQAPPELGQETKGTPAIDETSSTETSSAASIDNSAATSNKKAEKGAAIDNLLGTTTVKESKRESGQIYLIELDHSSGAKQYIEETDSDGKIQSTSNDIEETPNLPKWKIGSW